MKPLTHIFVDHEGHVFGSTIDPTPEDLDQARIGIVTIIRLADVSHYSRAKRWRSVPRAELGCAEIEDAKDQPFHSLKERFRPRDKGAKGGPAKKTTPTS